MKKTIVITGVGKGFGKELIKHLVDSYYVIGITRSEKDVIELEKDLGQKQGSFELIMSDVTDYESLDHKLSDSLHNRARSVFGLINNAGVRCRADFLGLSMAKIKEVLEVNLFAAIALSKFILPFFLKNGEGRIINVSSILSTNALPDLSAYTISKSALDGFTRSIATEFAHQGVTCNSILPGFCKTSYFDNFKSNEELYEMTLNRTPAKRWGTDDELIGLCELLLGDRGGYINGSSIPIDGGWTSS